VTDSMEEIRKSEGLTLEELEAQHIELLPDREEMNHFVNINIGAAAVAVQGAQAGFGQANQGFFNL
jgi:hypothetical protein